MPGGKTYQSFLCRVYLSFPTLKSVNSMSMSTTTFNVITNFIITNVSLQYLHHHHHVVFMLHRFESNSFVHLLFVLSAYFFFPFFPLVQLQSQQSSFVKKITIIAPLPPIQVYAIYRMSKRDHIWIFLHHISVFILQTIDNTTIRITIILIRMSTSSIPTIQIRMITKMRKRKPSGRALQKSEVQRQARIELRSSFWVRLGRHSSWLLSLSFYHHFLSFYRF